MQLITPQAPGIFKPGLILPHRREERELEASRFRVIHSRHNSAGAGGTWTGGGSLGVPDTISGLQMWLDASDTSTYTVSSTNVTQWNDKRGSSTHALVPGGASTYAKNTGTQNSLTTIQFNEVTPSWYKHNTGDAGVGDTWSFGVVGTLNGPNSASAQFLQLHSSSAASSECGLVITTNNFLTGAGPENHWGYANYISTLTGYHIWLGSITGGSSTVAPTIQQWEGTTSQSSANNQFTDTSSEPPVYDTFGLVPGYAPQSCDGYIGEFVLYNKVLSGSPTTASSEFKALYDYFHNKWAV